MFLSVYGRPASTGGEHCVVDSYAWVVNPVLDELEEKGKLSVSNSANNFNSITF